MNMIFEYTLSESPSCLYKEQDGHPLVVGVVDDLGLPWTCAGSHPRVHASVSLLRQGERVVDVTVRVKSCLTNISLTNIHLNLAELQSFRTSHCVMLIISHYHSKGEN